MVVLCRRKMLGYGLLSFIGIAAGVFLLRNLSTLCRNVNELRHCE